MNRVPQRLFTEDQLRALAQALGEGLTGSEIDDLLHLSRVPNAIPGGTKWKRIYYSLWNKQCEAANRTDTLQFIRLAMQPARYVLEPQRYEPLRHAVNKALSFAELQVFENGFLVSSDRVSTLPEAEERAKALRGSLEIRGVHPVVLRYCRAKLLEDNYFHAVLEATKSVFDRVRQITGLQEDGAQLIDKVFGGSAPMLAINALTSDSEISEQKGFMHLTKGAYGMFRNPTAHEARIRWSMSKADAEDLLSLVSLIHRRLDSASKL